MSKLNNRTAVKNLTNLNVDCQYVYQLGLQVFNDNGQNPDAYKQLCSELTTICDELEIALAGVRKLIPDNLGAMQNVTQQ